MKYKNNLRALSKWVAIIVAFFIVLTPVVPAFADEITAPVESAPITDIITTDPGQDSASPTVDDTTPSDTITNPGENVAPTDGDSPIDSTPQSNSMTSSQPGPDLSLATSGIKSNLPDVDKASGALFFNYPLNIPPGRNGLQPDLKLVYSSQGGQAGKIYGDRWSDNIPYIERINRYGTDQLYSTSLFSSSMDGELVTVSAGVYQAKVENGSFLKYSLSSNVWTVTDKKGTVYKFGTNAAERQDNPSNSSNIFKWMLQEVRDTNNNYIKYEYSKDQGEIYPYKITYTGNNITDGIFVVEFTKTSRTNPIVYAKPGFTVKAAYYINQIDAKINGTWARRYVLAYTAADNGQSLLLNTITESGQDESANAISLPVQDFDYQVSTASGTSWPQDTNWSAPVSNTADGVVIADVNGDGLDDFIQSYDYGTWVKGTYLNTGSGGWSSTTDFVPPVRFQTNGYDPGVRPMDVNGDGLVDLVQSTAGPGGVDNTWINNGSGWVSSTNWHTALGFANTNNFSDTGTRIGDFNGDGLPDLVNYSNGLYLNNGSTGWTSTGWTIPVDLSHSVIAADVNGDGLDDLVQAYDSSPDVFQTWINNGNGWTSTSDFVSPVLFKDSFNRDYGVRAMDVNGDGLPDLIQKSSGQCGATASWLNNGIGWTSTIYWQAPIDFSTCSTGALDNGTRTGDFNGDGKVDFVNVFNGSTSLYLHAKNKADVMSKITYPRGGNTEIVYQASPQYMSGSTKLNPNLPMNLLTVKQLTNDDGFNLDSSSTFTYEGGKYYYSSASDRKFAGFAKITKIDAAGNKIKTYYHQGDSTDSTHGEYSDDDSKIGKIYRVEITDSTDNIYAKKISKWENYGLGSGNDFVKLTRSTEFAYDGDSDHKEKSSTYTYDNTYGNLTQIVDYGEVSGSDDGTFTDSGTDDFTTTIDYASNTGAYILGLPKIETVTDHSATKVKESKYYYDAQAYGSVNKGNLTKQEDWKTSTTYVTSQKTYNSTYGTLASDIDQRSKTTTYTNDTYNLYPASESNPLTQITSYTYDYSLGKPKQITDANSRVFQTTYDALDRIIEEKIPDLVTPSTLVTKTTYTYTDQTVGLQTKKTDYLDSSVSADNYAYTDGFDRPIQTRKEMEGTNTYAVTDTIYNNIEQVYKESLPYSNTGTSKTAATTNTDLLVTYSYDPMMRITSTANVIGTTSNSYDDWKLTVTDPNSKVKDLYKDAYGNLIQVDEHNGTSTYTTTYQYNYLGNLTKITDALSNIRNFTYDGLGRRLTAQDLHASADGTYGTWTYTYDDAGNLTQVVDPKSQTINYTYDDTNRQLTEDYTGAVGTEVTNTYDSGTNGIGRLTGTTNSSVTKALVYNARGGLKQETETLNAVNYVTTYDYDRQGNQITITNPDSSKISYLYNSAGLLNNVKRKESTDASYIDVVTDFDYGPHGKVTYQANANGTATTNTYDATKLYRLTRKQTTSTATGGGTATTSTFYTSAGDGAVYHQDTSWDVAHDATTGTSSSNLPSTLIMRSGRNTSTSYRIERAFLPFDTSALPDGAFITSAKLKVFVESKLNDDNDGDDWVTVVQTTQPSTSGLTTADYDLAGAINNPIEGMDQSERKDITNISTTQYTTFNLNYTGKNWISKTGFTKLGLREGHDVIDSPFVGTSGQYNQINVRTSEYTGTASDPVLEVTYYTTAPTPATIQDASYTYDANGNILTITDASGTDTAKTSTYVYDDLNRLTSDTVTSATNGDNTTKTYSYDAIGNISSSSDLGTYTYAGTGYANPHAVTNVGSKTYSYDNNGNQTGDGNWTNTWDYQNRMTQSAKTGTTVTYTYDPSGQRVKLANGSTTTYYPTKLYNTDGTTPQKHIFANGAVIATVKGTGASASITTDHTDQLTGVGSVTNSSGAIVQLMDYYPFGTFRIDAEYGTNDEQRKFTGHEFDRDTGLNYFDARYYDPAIGRFISQDNVFLAVGNDSRIQQLTGLNSEAYLLDPQAMNSYAYARNNPITYVDMDGNYPSWNILKTYGTTAVKLAKEYIVYQTNKGLQELQQMQKSAAEWTQAHPKETQIIAMLLTDGLAGVKGLKTNLKNVEVESFGKPVYKGNVNLKPTLEKILSGEQAPRDIFRNDQKLLPVKKDSSYYQEYTVPTPGVKGAGPQRIIQGKGGEYYYTPDHYKTFSPLNK